jgi:immune inhibitor A
MDAQRGRFRVAGFGTVLAVSVLFCVLGVAGTGSAAPELARPQLMPPRPDVLAGIRAEGYDSVTVVNLRRLAERQKAAGIDKAEPISAPVLGNRPALVLLVNFPDLLPNALSTSAFYSNLLFSTGTYPSPGSMRDYYREVSYNLFDINPGWVDSAWRQASQPHNYYANFDGIPGNDDDYGTGIYSYPNNAQGLVVEAVTLADPYVNFASFAIGGQVQGLFVIHAGRGAETDTSRYDWIWSHEWALNSNAVTVDGVTVNLYSMEPEYVDSAGDSTIGVFCHEYGHVLGLPDLYDTDYTSNGLGRWSLMAAGCWNGPTGNGDSPAHPDAWCKIQLGWITPTVVSSNLTAASIPQVETNAAVYKLSIPSLPSTQYFLVENRRTVGSDTYLPGSGLCIYHVDETQGTNDNEWYPGHTASGNYKVALEQADGLWQLEQNANYGNTGDPWPGSANKRAFNNSTTPDTKNYAGQATYIAVANISDAGATMTADLTVHVVAVTASVLPVEVGSAGAAALTASASDSFGHGIASWSWSDGGAGGSFSPSAAVQNPTYTAPVNVSGADVPVTLTVTATCSGPPALSGNASTVLTVHSVVFVDVPWSYWARTYIEAIYNAGVTAGCVASPPLFCPSGIVTRGQMAIFLIRGMVETPCTTYHGYFTDVPESHPWWSWIERIYELNITAGCAGTPGVDLQYCPNQNVTRGQMAIFLIRAMEATPCSTYHGYFTDVPESHPWWSWIERIYELTITTGCAGVPGNLQYCLSTDIPRDQMAVFLQRAFNLTMGP